MRALHGLAVASFAIGCGDGSSTGDAPIDTPPLPPGCDYAELHDLDNDYSMASYAAEQTGLTFGAAARSVICGAIDNNHYIAATKQIDIDSFVVAVGADTDLELQLTAPGAEALDRVTFYVFDATNPTIYFGDGTFVGDHGMVVLHLPAGSYELDLEAHSAADTGSSIAYKLSLVPDMPDARCMKITTPANYTENHDGGGNVGNDMIGIDLAMSPSRILTPVVTDNPEPTLLAIDATASYRITGSSANVNGADSYMDRDTYAITTGAATNQLSVRLDWPGATADLDFAVFPENVPVDFSGGFATSNREDEFATFAVKPSTRYWLWVGGFDGSTGLPMLYDLSICGETFTP